MPTDHILTILAVSDLDRSVAFYRAGLGWEPRVEVPVYVELALPDGRGLGLYRREGFSSNTGRSVSEREPGTTTGAEIYLRCSDLETAIERIEAAGAERLSARCLRPWGDEAAYYADPDGNVVVLSQQSL